MNRCGRQLGPSLFHDQFPAHLAVVVTGERVGTRLVGGVKLAVSPGVIFTSNNDLSLSAVTVCATSSVLRTLIFSPGDTRFGTLYSKS